MPHVYTHSMYFSHIIIYISLHNMYLYVSMHLSDEACARAMMQSNAGKQNFAEARGKRGGGAVASTCSMCKRGGGYCRRQILLPRIA